MPVRAWAIGHGLIGERARGPIGHNVKVAYAKAHDLPEPEKPPAPASKRERKFSGSVCSCGRAWEGLVECHCRRCHLHFRSVIGFDMHLAAVPGTDETRCLPVEQIRYRSGQNKGEPKLRIVRAHHGELVVRAEERPDQESIFPEVPADE